MLGRPNYYLSPPLCPASKARRSPATGPRPSDHAHVAMRSGGDRRSAARAAPSCPAPVAPHKLHSLRRRTHALLGTAARTRQHTSRETPRALCFASLSQMRFFVALCYVMEATADSFEITFNINLAFGIGDFDSQPWWQLNNDKSDPFVGIFVDGRQIGLTPTRMDDHDPNWNTRIKTSVDQSEMNPMGYGCPYNLRSDPCPMICIALFDRDRFDDSEHYRSTFDGASLDQMKAENTYLASECRDVISWGGYNSYWDTRSCSETSCSPYSSGKWWLVVKCTDDVPCGTVEYEFEIVANLPPPSPPSPPPRQAPKSPRDFVEDMGEKAKDGISSMPAWLVAVLIGIGSVCALCCFCKYCCTDDDDRPPRSSVPAVHITRNHTGGAHHTEAGTELPGGRSSSSSSSSASGLQWNQWAALDRVLARTTHSAQNPGDSVLRAPH